MECGSGDMMPSDSNDAVESVGVEDLCEKIISGFITDASVQEFHGCFRNVLARKIFFNATDREAVEAIVDGYVSQRRLVDAVVQKDLDAVESWLDQLADTELLAGVLEQPVNEKGDTLLHIAVRCSSIEVTEALLEHGANKHATNIHGDMPTQRFMVPLLSGPARRCRHYKRDEDFSVSPSGEIELLAED